jgi:iron complex outermembrane receptor protein
MKLTTYLLLVTALHVSAGTFSQNVTISGKDLSLNRIFRIIKNQTGYSFIYNKVLLEKMETITLHVTNVPVSEVLTTCLKGNDLQFSITNGAIVIFKPAGPYSGETTHSHVPVKPPAPPILIRGRVFDTKEPPNPLSGVSIGIRHKFGGTSTDITGNFELTVEKGDTLVFSFTGYKIQEYPITNARENLNI